MDQWDRGPRIRLIYLVMGWYLFSIFSHFSVLKFPADPLMDSNGRWKFCMTPYAYERYHIKDTLASDSPRTNPDGRENFVSKISLGYHPNYDQTYNSNLESPK